MSCKKKKKKILTFLILSFPSHRDSLSVCFKSTTQKEALSDGQQLSAEIQYQQNQKIKQEQKQWRE